MDRRRARQIVLELLYQRELVGDLPEDAFAARALGAHREFVEGRVCGVIERMEELDRLLAPRTRNWRYERLGVTDRNILRLGAYELLFAPEIPPEVAIDEAVELCKAFGTDPAPSFVNGILDRLWKERIAGEDVAPAED